MDAFYTLSNDTPMSIYIYIGLADDCLSGIVLHNKNNSQISRHKSYIPIFLSPFNTGYKARSTSLCKIWTLIS